MKTDSTRIAVGKLVDRSSVNHNIITLVVLFSYFSSLGLYYNSMRNFFFFIIQKMYVSLRKTCTAGLHNTIWHFKNLMHRIKIKMYTTAITRIMYKMYFNFFHKIRFPSRSTWSFPCNTSNWETLVWTIRS